ncbi:SUMF1/EgtB/PvdO family nonheme iron enzyme [Leptothoe sp. EHU-05/26/07-4]
MTSYIIISRWCFIWLLIHSGDDTYRVLRSGSWIVGPAQCRSAFRMSSTPDTRVDYYGFRIACG